MCDGEFHERIPNENEGEHTPPKVVTRNTARIGGAAMPPPWGNHSPS
jgi:hypothetical protein